ncbi:MAG: type I-F CRISPR-associated protein Csy2 [Formosimonas sp.]
MRRFLLIPQLKIHNANAMSSPYTIGFPAMTAWLGAVHALQRRLQACGFADVLLTQVAVSCHDFNLQTHRSPNDFVSSIIGTSNPLDKDGNRPAFIEEARCHLRVSLLIEYQGIDPDHEIQWLEAVHELIVTMKFASGDVMAVRPPEVLQLDEEYGKRLKAVTDRLMLGYVIKERRDLMQAEMSQGIDALTALLNHIKVMHRADEPTPEQPEVIWRSKRKQAGWLIPIAVGFQGISPLGKAANQRDSDTPHRFAESVVTLGEFIMPYRIKNIDDVLWRYHSDLEHDLYVCQNQVLPLSN